MGEKELYDLIMLGIIRNNDYTVVDGDIDVNKKGNKIKTKDNTLMFMRLDEKTIDILIQIIDSESIYEYSKVSRIKEDKYKVIISDKNYIVRLDELWIINENGNIDNNTILSEGDVIYQSGDINCVIDAEGNYNFMRYFDTMRVVI